MPKPSEESFGSLGKPESSLDDDFELDELDGVSRKPHFLDYDNKPPAELVEPQQQQLHRCWNGARKELSETTVEGEERKNGTAEVDEGEEKRENNVRNEMGGVVCGEQQSLLFHRPVARGSYDLGMATTLSILPTKKQSAVNGTRVGSTWPIKERMVGLSPRRQEQPPSQPLHHAPAPLSRGELGEVGPKMECVYSLLSMLGSTNVLEMSCKFLELSRNEEKCSALRRSGCVPLLVHIIHNEPNETARRNARHALTNVVRCNLDDGSARRELKVLRLIDQLIDYTDLLKEQPAADGSKELPAGEGETILPNEAKDGMNGIGAGSDPERHPIQAIGTLAKISYDEEHRHAMCQFGALQTIASLIQLDHHVHGSASSDALKCVELRRYASMVLTNLTFGQGNNKMLLCANRDFMRALVSQLGCTELVQVTASVLRNLSWRADTLTKQTLVEIETVTLLMEAAMRCTVENTLKSILSALWNLSNHCTQNRAKVCEVPGALEFLIDLLSYEAPSKTWSIVENAGGILRNVSSHVAQCEQYRRVLRHKQCLKLLLDQLKSPSLTVVSNACGTLGNLSSENEEDQRFLREHGAIPMLRSLIYSKHNIISNGSRLALKNLQQQQHRPAVVTVVPVIGVHDHPNAAPEAPVWSGKDLPGLNVRKQRAMEQELGCAFYRKQSEPVANGQDEDHRLPGRHHHADVALSPDPDPDPETPINYGLTEERLHQHSYDYQETDIDQLTDYSLRYAENQSDTEDEEKDEEEERRAVAYRHVGEAGDPGVVNVLMPEDSVKCYYTEGTPQIISSATSMSDLRAVAGPQPTKAMDGDPGTTIMATVEASSAVVDGTSKEGIGGPVRKSIPIPIAARTAVVPGDDLGCNTPDKPFNYCEEGTPDFSRETSLSIIDLEERDMKLMQQHQHQQKQEQMEEVEQVSLVQGQQQPQQEQHEQQHMQQQQQEQPQPLLKSPTTASIVIDPATSTSTPGGTVGKSVSFLNTGADETPLMFSRTSSMGSLSSAEPACTDDKSSIVSEFSRMASGVMSPSELPDSPTQTIPHSPHPPQQMKRPLLPKTSPPDDDGGGGGAGGIDGDVVAGAVRGDGVGAFADTVSAFNVEHTPAQFSCATSLSNLSLLDEKDEVMKHEEAVVQEVQQELVVPSQPPVLPNPADVVLLGMVLNGPSTTADTCPVSDGDSDGGGGEDDELLASCISIGMNSVAARSSAAKQKSSFQTVAATLQTHRRCTLDDGPDSDDSSNLSDNNDRLLEECILSGMPKPKQPTTHPLIPPGGPVVKENPFKMMRTNHPMMAPANDELNPYHIEDSPCNFSTVSALSDLTMASDTMTTPRSLESMDRKVVDALIKGGYPKKREVVPVVSSPSVESETDDHLLDEAIAAGITGKGPQKRARDELESREEVSARGWISPPQRGRPTDGTPPDDEEDGSEQEEDYELLAQCIRKGMRSTTVEQQQQPPQRTIHHPSTIAIISLPKQTNPKNVQTTPAMSKVVGAFEVSPGVGNRVNNHLRTSRSASVGSTPSPGYRTQPDTSGSTDSSIIFHSCSQSSADDSSSTIGAGVRCPGTITIGDVQPVHGRDRAVAAEPITNPSTRRTVPIGCEPVGKTDGAERPKTADVSATSDEDTVKFKIGERVTSSIAHGKVIRKRMPYELEQLMFADAPNLDSVKPPSIIHDDFVMRPAITSAKGVLKTTAKPPECTTRNSPARKPFYQRFVSVNPIILRERPRSNSNPVIPTRREPGVEPVRTHDVETVTVGEQPAQKPTVQRQSTFVLLTSPKRAERTMRKSPERKGAQSARPVETGVSTPKINTKRSERVMRKSPVRKPFYQRCASVNSIVLRERSRSNSNPVITTKRESEVEPVRPHEVETATVGEQPAQKPTVQRQNTFVLEKPLLSVHLPQPRVKVQPKSKIPLPKGVAGKKEQQCAGDGTSAIKASRPSQGKATKGKDLNKKVPWK